MGGATVTSAGALLAWQTRGIVSASCGNARTRLVSWLSRYHRIIACVIARAHLANSQRKSGEGRIGGIRRPLQLASAWRLGDASYSPRFFDRRNSILLMR